MMKPWLTRSRGFFLSNPHGASARSQHEHSMDNSYRLHCGGSCQAQPSLGIKSEAKSANSDINVTSRETRRTVILHGLISFFLVIALVVNLTAQFAG